MLSSGIGLQPSGVKTFSAFQLEETGSYTYNPLKNMSVEPMGSNDAKTLNINRYATKKTISQGMMDIALLTANASQLRYVLSLGESHEFYKIMLGLIITSLVLQMLIGLSSLSLTMLRDCCLENEDYHFSANVFNQINMITVFVITVINILMAGIGVFDLPSSYINF